MLAGLQEPEATAVTKGGSVVDLKAKHQIYRPHLPIRDVFFPIDCVFSVVTRMKGGKQVEIGTVGREGTTGVPLLLGAATTTNECYCQVPGNAIKIDVGLFQSLRASPKFRQLLDHYVQAYVILLGQLVACNRLHHVYARCARWLLMTQDRVGIPEIRMTHEYMAMMLGTTRAGVTTSAAKLQNEGFIRYSKGVIRIVDRAGLEGASCECYDVVRELFISPPGFAGGSTADRAALPETSVSVAPAKPKRLT